MVKLRLEQAKNYDFNHVFNPLVIFELLWVFTFKTCKKSKRKRIRNFKLYTF